MRKLGENFIYQFTYQILAILLPLVTAPYVSRVIGAESIGVYTYTFTVAYYFYIFCMLGFETYGQRRIASYQKQKEKRSKEFSEIFSIQLFVTLFGTLVYIIYAILFSGNKLLAAIQIIYVASSCSCLTWLFAGVEEFKKVATRNTLIKVVSTILIFCFVKSSNDVWLYALIIALSTFIGNFIFIINANKYVSFTRVKLQDLKKHIQPILLIFIPQISITIFLQIDKLMLGWWSNARNLGYYQNAEKIINIPITLITTVGIVLLPRIVRMKSEGLHKEIGEFNRLVMNMLMYIGIGCMFGVIAVSKDFTPWFFGPDFIDCDIIVSSLSITIVFMVWENVIQKQYLIPYNRDKLVVVCMVFAAIVNIILNSLLIPNYGAFGAIIGSIASHFVICSIEAFVLKDEIPIKRYIKDSIPALIPGVIMYFVITMFSSSVCNINISLKILLELLIGVVTYFIISIILMYFTHSPILMSINKILKKIRLI